MIPLSDVSLVFNILSKDKASAGIVGASNAVRTANRASAASAVALVAAEASAAAWAVSVGAAISGSIGLAPGIFMGAAAAGIGLKVALSGLSGAWKALGQQQSSSGTSAAEVAKQHTTAVREVTSAQEALTKAQRDALSAQQAISDAEETAAKNLRDLTISVANARLDEQTATLAVADAQRDLVTARQSGNAEEIQKANIAYQQSINDLETATNRTSDLAEENTKATAAGVEGSDAVVSARQQEADATQAVADATQRLADARANLNSGSGGGGAAESAAALAMAKLSTNGKAVVLTLKSLGPAWTAVKKSMQDKTLAGVSGDIRDLSSRYLPVLHTQLDGMGSAFNAAIRQSLGVLKTKQSVNDVNTLLGNTNKATKLLGTAFAPIISGLLGMGAAGSNFLPKLAGWVHGLAVEFGAWVTSARQSGQLAAWLNTAETALHNVWIIAGNVAGILGAIFKAGGSGEGSNFLVTIATMTTKLKEFLASPKGQHDLQVFFGDLRDILGTVGKVLPGVTGHLGAFKDAASVAQVVVHELASHTGLLAKVLPFLAVGYALAKVASNFQLAYDIAHLPILAASAIANWALAAAIRGQTAATQGATVAQEELDVAMDANPIGLIVGVILILIGVFVLLWTKCSWFRDFWIGLWHIIEAAASAVWSWIKDHWQLLLAILTGPVGLAVLFIKDHFNTILSFITGLPGKIAKVAKGMWHGITDSFKDALNWIIQKWNGLGFHLTIPRSVLGIPVPGGGSTVGFDTPNIPLLASGGDITSGGVAIVGEKGPEPVLLPAGARVLPHGSTTGGHDCNVTLTINSGGSQLDDAIVQIIRKAVRAQGGNGLTLGIRTVG